MKFNVLVIKVGQCFTKERSAGTGEVELTPREVAYFTKIKNIIFKYPIVVSDRFYDSTDSEYVIHQFEGISTTTNVITLPYESSVNESGQLVMGKVLEIDLEHKIAKTHEI